MTAKRLEKSPLARRSMGRMKYVHSERLSVLIDEEESTELMRQTMSVHHGHTHPASDYRGSPRLINGHFDTAGRRAGITSLGSDRFFSHVRQEIPIQGWESMKSAPEDQKHPGSGRSRIVFASSSTKSMGKPHVILRTRSWIITCLICGVVLSVAIDKRQP